MLDLSIVIVSYNVADCLRTCLDTAYESVRVSGLETEIVVVDNDSKDGSPEMVEVCYPAVTLLRNSDNTGYGRACNRGASVANGAVLLFLNADVALNRSSVRELWEALQGDVTVGLIGPAIQDTHFQTLDTIRRFPTLRMWLLDGTIFERWPATNWMLDGYKLLSSSDRTRAVDWVEGACLAVKHEAFEAVGGFDPSYFLYCEELDLCQRLEEKKWQRLYVPGAVVVHGGGASASQCPAVSRALFLRSKVQYAAGTWGVAISRVAFTFFMVALLIELALEVSKLCIPLGGTKARARSASTLLSCLKTLALGTKLHAY